MEYKLSEEQSEEFLNHMFLIDKFSEDLNTSAIRIISNWYHQYQKNRKWFWLKRDFNSFLHKISFSDEVEIKHSSMGYSYVSIGNDKLWEPGFKVSVLSELTGIKVSTLMDEVNEVWRSVEFMHKNITFLYKNYDTLSDIKTYCKIPFTLDEKYLHHKKSCALIIKDWNIEE